MIIAYGSPPMLLCRGGIEQPIGLSIEASRTVQVVKPIEAAGVSALGRANKQTTVSFSVLREHANYSAAELYVATHESSLPDNGTLSIRPETAGESVYEDAALQGCRVTYLGVTTTATYSFIAGAKA
jgi:hypothetical protein